MSQSRAHHIAESYLLHIMLTKPPFQPSIEKSAYLAALSYLILWAPLTPDGVQLVDKYDRRLFFARSGEQITNSFGADTDEHLIKFGPMREMS